MSLIFRACVSFLQLNFVQNSPSSLTYRIAGLPMKQAFSRFQRVVVEARSGLSLCHQYLQGVNRNGHGRPHDGLHADRHEEIIERTGNRIQYAEFGVKLVVSLEQNLPNTPCKIGLSFLIFIFNLSAQADASDKPLRHFRGSPTNESSLSRPDAAIKHGLLSGSNPSLADQFVDAAEESRCISQPRGAGRGRSRARNRDWVGAHSLKLLAMARRSRRISDT